MTYDFTVPAAASTLTFLEETIKRFALITNV